MGYLSGLLPLKARQDHINDATVHIKGIGILKAIFGQSEKYRRGRGMSSTPVRGLKMREAGCVGAFPAVVHRVFPTIAPPLEV